MSILEELGKRGIDVTKTDSIFYGLQKTEKGYISTRDSSKCERGVYFLELSNGATIHCDDSIVYLVKGTEYEDKVKSKEDAAKLASEGKIFSFKSSDLYAEFYNFAEDRELECCFKYQYSSRSRDYIEKIMKEIGLVRYTDASNYGGGEDGVMSSFQILRIYDIFINLDIYVGKIGDLWIAQAVNWYIVDDYAVIKMYFDHLPSEQEVKTAFDVMKFEEKPIEVFKCYECGRRVHWLDTPPETIGEKYYLATDRYCGMC